VTPSSRSDWPLIDDAAAEARAAGTARMVGVATSGKKLLHIPVTQRTV